MAFPYQFGSPGNLALESCDESKFQIYCNTLLTPAERLQHWYQYVNLYLVYVAAGVPLVLWTVQYFWRAGQRWRQRRQDARAQGAVGKQDKRESDLFPLLFPLRLSGNSSRSSGVASPQTSYSAKPSEASRHSSMTSRNSGSSTPQQFVGSPPVALRADVRKTMQSISLLSEGSSSVVNVNSLQNCDLHMIPLFAETGKDTPLSSASPRASTLGSLPGKTYVGLFELQDLGTGVLSGQALRNAVAALDTRRAEKGCVGLVLRITNRDTCTPQITELLHELCRRLIGVVLMCDPDTQALRSINFGLLVGAVFENACILDSGKRRNFFRTVDLREMMGRCADERVIRPAFLVKFLDLWSVQPTAAVVRRAHKLAEYFGASLEHGARSEQRWAEHVKFPISLSAFDYLKRSDVVEVSRS
jgi:hypothetical protein